MKLLPYIISLLVILLIYPAHADQKPCTYLNENGRIERAYSLEKIPRKFRGSARCVTTKGKNDYKWGQLASPDKITLQGNIRRETINSTLGEVNLRWPRSIESLFGRTPLRAMTDAINTVSRAVKNAAFPTHVQNFTTTWNVVFMDENLPESQIPSALISNCHPGWMTPPGNIYIVAQRIAAGCGGSKAAPTSVADAALTETLIHELGHAVEAQLLKGRMGQDRMQAEGFATWFEMYASQYSSIISPVEIKKKTHMFAKISFRQSPERFVFNGGADDYARASMYYAALADRRGLHGLMEIYQTMADSSMDLFSAVEARANLSRAQLEQDARKFSEKY